MNIIRFTAQPIVVLAAEDDGTPRRTIQGIAVPWDVTASASTGKVRFLPGSLPADGPAPKLLRDHDHRQPIGVVTERVPTDEGMMFSARISETAAGNEALVLAADGVLDAVSVGAYPVDFTWDGDTMVVAAAEWRELSVLPFGAFDSARIHQVAAEAADDSEAAEADEPETETQPEEEAPVTEATIPTSPIVVASSAPALTRPRLTAAEAVSGILCQKRDVLEILAVVADNTLTDIPGLLPEPLIGEVWTTQYAQRPIIDAVGTRALPIGGESFVRRYIANHTAVAEQTAEFNELASSQFTVSRAQVDKKTFGGVINVSSQSGDWSQPALVQQILNDMIRQYAIATEAYVAGVVAAANISATDTVADFTDGDDVIAALYNGAAEMRTATGVLPTHLIVSTDVWADLGQSKTAGGAYIFPYLNPSNAFGQMGGAAVMTGNPLGLSLVISDDMGAPSQACLAYGPAIEVYEDRSRTGGVRVENPASASATLGLWGYLGALVMPVAGSSYILSLV